MQVTTNSFSYPEFINPSWRIGIVHTLYYSEYILKMVEGAKECLLKTDIVPEKIKLFPVLGSWEIPLIGAKLAKSGNFDALLGFGIIVKGETFHDEHLARETAKAMMDIQVQYGMPFAYEILHVKSLDQVPSRIEGSFNKGTEAAMATLHSLAQMSQIRS